MSWVLSRKVKGELQCSVEAGHRGFYCVTCSCDGAEDLDLWKICLMSGLT